MPDDTHDQHDISLLGKATAIAWEALATGLLSASECTALRAEIASLQSTITALTGRRDPVH